VLLDSLVIILMAAVAAGLGYLLAGVAGAVVGYVLGGFGGPIVYSGYLHSHHGRGQTLGKRATGIAVRGIDGVFLGVGPAMGRYAIQIVFGIFYLPSLLDYLWPLWDDRNQSLHDKVVNSVVVRT
jgi:uncharacterized RDD family membrane protein YckC